jgi:hypothetical protein
MGSKGCFEPMSFRPLAIAFSASCLAQTSDLNAIAKLSGTPDIRGLKTVWLASWGGVTKAHPWANVIVHQTEGPAGSARNGAFEQSKNPTRRGVMVWVETDGTVYWAVPETVVTAHGDGANRNDSKYIDNSKTYHQVVKDNSAGQCLAHPGAGVARAIRYSARPRLRAQLDRLQGCALLRRLCLGDDGKGAGRVTQIAICGASQIGRAIQRRKRRIGRGKSHRGRCGASPAAMQR